MNQSWCSRRLPHGTENKSDLLAVVSRCSLAGTWPLTPSQKEPVSPVTSESCLICLFCLSCFWGFLFPGNNWFFNSAPSLPAAHCPLPSLLLSGSGPHSALPSSGLLPELWPLPGLPFSLALSTAVASHRLGEVKCDQTEAFSDFFI